MDAGGCQERSDGFAGSDPSAVDEEGSPFGGQGGTVLDDDVEPHDRLGRVEEQDVGDGHGGRPGESFAGSVELRSEVGSALDVHRRAVGVSVSEAFERFGDLGAGGGLVGWWRSGGLEASSPVGGAEALGRPEVIHLGLTHGVDVGRVEGRDIYTVI